MPESGTLRLGGIENFDAVQRFFADAADRVGCAIVGYARIDKTSIALAGKGCSRVTFEFDPHGLLDVVCSQISLA